MAFFFFFLFFQIHFTQKANLCRYEAVFYGALALVLVAWILFENTLLYTSKVKRSSASFKNLEDNVLENDDRYLQLSDVRIPLIFVSYIFSLVTLPSLFSSTMNSFYSNLFHLIFIRAKKLGD